VSLGLVSVFGRAFEEHIERIKRIVEEEVPGCSASFDQGAWPIIRFVVQDAQGITVSRMYSNFSISDLENMPDRKLRALIRRRCEPVNGELGSGLNKPAAVSVPLRPEMDESSDQNPAESPGKQTTVGANAPRAHDQLS
jgi:hypothetical protein